MKVISMILVCISILCSCQNDRNTYKIKNPPRAQKNIAFRNEADSLKYRLLIQNIDTLLEEKHKTEEQILERFTLINNDRELQIPEFEVEMLITKLFSLNQKVATETCFRNFDVTYKTNEPKKEDILRHFPFLRIASENLFPIEFVNAISDSKILNNCLSAKEQMKIDELINLAILNSLYLKYSPNIVQLHKQVLIDYLIYFMNRKDVIQNTCLYQNLDRLKENIIRTTK